MSMIAYGEGLLIVGIEAENIKRLKAGQPMRFSKKTHPGYPLETDLVICVGEPDDLLRQIRKAGLLPPDAAVIDHRSGTKES